jgi:serine/threonine protein kinase
VDLWSLGVVLYVMLSGFFPFLSHSQALLYFTSLYLLYSALLLLFFFCVCVLLLLLKDAARAAKALPQNQDVRVFISSGVLERRV